MPTSSRPGLLTRLRTLWLAQDLPDHHERRIHRMRLLGCAAMVLLGGGWGTFFATQGQMLLAAWFWLLPPCGVAIPVLAARKHPQMAHLLMFGMGIVVIAGAALVLDAPSAQAQRTIHLFLLPLGVAAFLTFRSGRPWVSYAIAGVCFALFLGMTASSWTPWPAYTLPEGLRSVGKWINAIGVWALLLSVLHILHAQASQHAGMDRELQTALREQQFVVHYQPQLDPSRRVTGAEVLVRWQHPQRGLLPPGIFIDHAERSGLMVPLGQWILEQACAQLRQWKSDPVLSELELAVNVSQLQFRQPQFAADVLGAVNRHGIAPHRLELELTETLMVLDMDDLHAKMRVLQEAGLRFSLDDFGTGFSSLSHLRQLPLHTLKIDRSFVKDLPQDASSQSIVRSLLGLAKSMGLIVVAEGIETQEQHAFLSEHGCPRFQGYLFSKPLPAKDFMDFVRRCNTGPGAPASFPVEPVAQAQESA